MKADEVFGTLNKRIEQGGVTDETIKKIVEQYFEEHPVQITTDNTLSIAGAPADAKVTGDKLSGLGEKTNSLKEDIGKVTSVEEFFSELECTVESGYINVSGTLSTSYYHIRQQVKKGEKYKIKSCAGSNVIAYVISNDSGHQTRHQPTENWETNHNYDIEITIADNEDGYFLYVNSLKENMIGLQKSGYKTKLNVGSLKNTIGSEELKNNSVNFEKLSIDILTLFKDKYSPIWKTIESGYVSTKGVLTESNNHCSIVVKKGEKYKIFSKHGWDLKAYVFCDSSGSVVDYYPTSMVSETTESIVFTANQDGTLHVNSFGDRYLRITKKEGARLIDSANNLEGKKGLFFGDSITANNGSWADFSTIALNNDMNTTNFGVGGSTMAVKSDSNSENCIFNRIKAVKKSGKYDEQDYIIIEGGVNDAFQNLSVGTMSEDFTGECDTTTFAGAFESTIRYVLTNWTNAKVGFVCCYKILGLAKLETYLDMAKNICKKYSIPYKDLFNESGYCVDLETVKEKYTTDGTHINKDGYNDLINDKVEGFMKSL